jgi:hypothetical protein
MPLVPKLLRPSVILRRNATYKGLLGGQKGWLAVGVVLWSKSFLKRTFGKSEEILTTEKLTKGQFLRIDAVQLPSRRQRKATQRTEKRSIAAAKASANLTAAAAKAAKAEARAQRSAAKRSA